MSQFWIQYPNGLSLRQAQDDTGVYRQKIANDLKANGGAATKIMTYWFRHWTPKDGTIKMRPKVPKSTKPDVPLASDDGTNADTAFGTDRNERDSSPSKHLEPANAETEPPIAHLDDIVNEVLAEGFLAGLDDLPMNLTAI
jgi:hypothetical protein